MKTTMHCKSEQDVVEITFPDGKTFVFQASTLEKMLDDFSCSKDDASSSKSK